MPFLSVSKATQIILSNPAPIAFIDTCIFLDILRLPYRDNGDATEIKTIMELIETTQAIHPRAYLVSCETVYKELHENIASVKEELNKEIVKAKKIATKIKNCYDLLEGVPIECHRSRPTSDLPDKLENLASSLVNSCLLFCMEDQHSIKAMERVNKCKPPSKRGKQEAKDCQIFESFLDMAMVLRGQRYADYITFITSNTQDYGKPRDNLLIPDLTNVNAEFTTSLQWAWSRIINNHS